MSKFEIDLNLDAGESPEALQDGSEEALYQWVTSVNIACGGHAGDEASMSRAVELALKYQLGIGAHPSFPDREGFGRNVLQMPREELVDSLVAQIESLRKVCRKAGAQLRHVKPHGALYNLAATDSETAQAVIEAVKRVDPSLAVVGLAGSMFLKWCTEAGLKPIAEAFADRRYEKDGSLRNRRFADAMIEDPKLAAEQAVSIVCDHSAIALDGSLCPILAETLCVHGDSNQALETARQVYQGLRSAGVTIKSLLPE